jgi:hypothetical protein
MAKVSGLFEDLYTKLGATMSEEQKEKLSQLEAEVDDDFADSLLEVHIENYGKNRTLSTHQSYDSGFAELKDIIGEENFGKLSSKKGVEKFKILKDEFNKKVQSIEKKIQEERQSGDADSQELAKYKRMVSELKEEHEAEIAVFKSKNVDELETRLKKTERESYENYLKRFIERQDIDPRVKSSERKLNLIISDFEDALQKNGWQIDQKTREVKTADGIAAMKRFAEGQSKREVTFEDVMAIACEEYRLEKPSEPSKGILSVKTNNSATNNNPNRADYIKMKQMGLVN